MCGIAGFISTTPRDGPAMVASLHHRGPDASGGFGARVADRQAWLGHARLSIIDLSAAGTQPMFAAGEDIALVFNGEIYNYRELRSRFLADVPFHSGTDTEVLLALYERMGPACLEQLNGDFAVAILDRRAGRLLLVRDRVGVKPLYYWQAGADLVFGSEIKALLAGGVPAALATERLQAYFVYKDVPGNDTLFRGVQRLPPGHLLEYDLASGRSTVRRWWQPRIATDDSWTYEAAQARAVELVADATRLRLVSDVPVGNFLSGGLDSSIIASFLREAPQIAHYCARQSEVDVAREGTSSDFAHADRLARDWGLSFRPIDIGAAEITREQISRTVRFADDLIADSAQIPTYLITAGGAATSRVFLSGMGADEIFLGYAGHLLTLLAGRLEHLPGHPLLLRSMAGIAQGRGRLKSLRRYLYKLGKYRGHGQARPAIFSLVGDFDTAAGLVPGDAGALLDGMARHFPAGEDPFEGFKRFEFDNFLQKNLSYTDRMAMANSVEVRVPFLDHRLVEFAWSLPRTFKLSNLGRSKRILKDAFRERIPGYVVHRKKAGFAMPIRSIFGDTRRTLELLDLPLLADTARVEPAAARAIVESHVAGLEDNSALIYALLSFQEWHRIYLR